LVKKNEPTQIFELISGKIYSCGKIKIMKGNKILILVAVVIIAVVLVIILKSSASNSGPVTSSSLCDAACKNQGYSSGKCSCDCSSVNASGETGKQWLSSIISDESENVISECNKFQEEKSADSQEEPTLPCAYSCCCNK